MIWEMGASECFMALLSPLEEDTAGGDSLGRVEIKAGTKLRMFHLQCNSMEDVADNKDTVKIIDGVSRCMSRSGNRSDAIKEDIARLKRRHTSSINLHHLLHHTIIHTQGTRSPCLIFWIREMDDRIGKCRLALLGEESANMVKMQMRKANVGDVGIAQRI